MPIISRFDTRDAIGGMELTLKETRNTPITTAKMICASSKKKSQPSQRDNIAGFFHCGRRYLWNGSGAGPGRGGYGLKAGRGGKKSRCARSPQ